MAVFRKQEAARQSVITNGSGIHTVLRTTSVIGKTLLVKGEIASDEEVLVEGTVEGKLNIKHRVIVGKNGQVNADIEAREVIIKGTVNGNVNGSYKVEVIPEGVLNGNIVSQRVVLAEGALFKGNIDMTPKDDTEPPG
jgi:cytoskeletal protein CcmA (bactofilin family)